jgi:hypothetical protein
MSSFVVSADVEGRLARTVETFHDSCDNADLRGTFQGTSQHGDVQAQLQDTYRYVVISLSFDFSSELN